MRRALALLSAAALGAAGLALTTPASAAPAEPATPDAASHGRSSTASERSAIAAYWTPERMASAIPAERLVASRSTGSKAEAKPDQVAQAKPGTSSGGTSVSGATWVKGQSVAKTTGKVFFTLGGTRYVCSGSVVRSENKNTVLTAGHCAHEGPGSYATEWAFVPGYDGHATDVSPYGVWAFEHLQTTSQWLTSGDFDFDVAFARVDDPDSTATLEDTVGAQAIAFNQRPKLSVYAFGYPAASPYDGTTLTYCAGATAADPYGYGTQGLVCNMTGGSSGGPWYSNFSASSGTGTAYSLNSYRYTSGPYKNRMFGPQFGSVVETLFNNVSASAAPAVSSAA